MLGGVGRAVSDGRSYPISPLSCKTNRDHRPRQFSNCTVDRSVSPNSVLPPIASSPTLQLRKRQFRILAFLKSEPRRSQRSKVTSVSSAMKNDAQYMSQSVNVTRVSFAPSKCEPSAMQSTYDSSLATVSILSALLHILSELGMFIIRRTLAINSSPGLIV